jgi:uncharacterized membrane protein YbhN (UPF0104 family)
MRRLLSFAAKAAVSAFLLYLSLRRVNLENVGQQLSTLDWRWGALALSVACVQVPLSAWRWREIVAICGSRLSQTTALRYTIIGQFFSQVLPSTVGGDAVRIWLLARGGAGWQIAVYSVLIDRVVGVTVLALLVAGCLPWTFQLVLDPVARVALVLIGFGALGAALIFLGLGIPQLKFLDRWWPTRHLATASRQSWKLCRSSAGLRVVAYSFAVHFMTVALTWSAAMAAHASVSFVQTLYLMLPVILIVTIPISIAGWGVRESAMILAFSYAGLLESDGLIVSILFGLTTLAVGAIGGIVWIASGYRWRTVKAIEADTLAHDPSVQ